MRNALRHLTLSRIGVGLFVIGIVLLIAVPGYWVLWSAVQLYYTAFPAPNVTIGELGGGRALLLGLACLLGSAVVFALASSLERLARIEAKLDALAKARTPAKATEDVQDQ